MSTKRKCLLNTKHTKRAGFSSVFIVMILSSLMALLVVVITASLDRAADSIADTVTANAGSSVLTECNKDLHDQYGVLAIRNNTSHLSNMADYYISESIDGLNRFVHLDLNAAIVNIDKSNDLYISEFKKQISELGIKRLVFKKTKDVGMSSFYGANLPSQKYGGFAGFSAGNVVGALNLNSTGGICFGISSYVMNTFTPDEVEYLLFGGPDIASNTTSTKEMIFAIRCLIDCVENIEDPIMLIEAIAKAWRETQEIMDNPLELERYLKAMVSVMAVGNKLSYRIMDLMQLTIGGDFNFEDYAYGFELTAQFSRGKKNGIVTQIHKYTY